MKEKKYLRKFKAFENFEENLLKEKVIWLTFTGAFRRLFLFFFLFFFFSSYSTRSFPFFDTLAQRWKKRGKKAEREKEKKKERNKERN